MASRWEELQRAEADLFFFFFLNFGTRMGGDGEVGVMAAGLYRRDVQGQRSFWLVSGIGPRATSE